MNKFAMLLVIAALLFPATFARAQQPITLSNLEVELWPEYDQPSVLVIIHLTLDSSVPLPTEVSVLIPSSAEINAVASKDVDGELLNVRYTPVATDAWQVIRVTVALPELQIEYYDELNIEGTQRSFTYQWPGDFEVTRTIVALQQPVDASFVTVIPGPVTSQASQVDGLTYYFKEVGALNAGQGFELVIGYQKSSDRLTAGTQLVSPSEPLPSETTGLPNFNLWLTIGLGVLGLVLIAGGVLWYWRSSQQEVAPRRRSRGRSSSRFAREQTATGEDIYCQQCGRRASSGDRFCRTCGTRLRTEGS